MSEGKKSFWRKEGRRLKETEKQWSESLEKNSTETSVSRGRQTFRGEKKKKDVRKAKEILQKESSFVSTLHWKCEPAKKDKKIKDIQTRKEEI